MIFPIIVPKSFLLANLWSHEHNRSCLCPPRPNFQIKKRADKLKIFGVFFLSRWRQWEALDCNDVDSVHNDFQRELPYVLFFPDLLENVVRAWARFQHPAGYIQETLQMQWGCHNRTNRLDTPGGRVMADVTPAFLAQVFGSRNRKNRSGLTGVLHKAKR